MVIFKKKLHFFKSFFNECLLSENVVISSDLLHVFLFLYCFIDLQCQKCSKSVKILGLQLLEVCVDSVESAMNAFTGGARRLELCSSLSLGGLTPSLGLFRVIRKSLPGKCALFVMIRPKADESYVCSNHDVEVMMEDIKLFKENGVDGFVFGCLNLSKEIDEESCKKLLNSAQGLPCTFHRAFDIVSNPEESLITLINLGFSRILTSGQEESAFLGRHLIKKLVSKVENLGSGLIIVAGGGICLDNLKNILETTKVKECHSSARAKGTNKEQCNIYVTDASVVKEMIETSEKIIL